jgi:hypothetical protein
VFRLPPQRGEVVEDPFEPANIERDLTASSGWVTRCPTTSSGCGSGDGELRRSLTWLDEGASFVAGPENGRRSPVLRDQEWTGARRKRPRARSTLSFARRWTPPSHARCRRPPLLLARSGPVGSPFLGCYSPTADARRSQLASDPLLTLEQIAIGGADRARIPENLLVADRGVNGRAAVPVLRPLGVDQFELARSSHRACVERGPTPLRRRRSKGRHRARYRPSGSCSSPTGAAHDFRQLEQHPGRRPHA